MIIAIDARESVGAFAGKGRYIRELILALMAIDHENSYYLYSKQPLDYPLTKNFHSVQIGGWPGLRQIWMADDAKKRQADLLFAPTGYLPVIFSQIPSVLTIHDLALFVTRTARPALKTTIAERLLIKPALRRAAHIIAISDSTRNDLIEVFRIKGEKITVTHLGYDAKFYTPKPHPTDKQILDKYKLTASANTGKKYLLFVGTLEPRKNIAGLIQAYAKIPANLRKRYPLVLAGGNGWHYQEIYDTVAKLNIGPDLHFLGRVADTDLPALYRGAKIFLFPSFYEGFGLPSLEAIACGTPVIAGNNSSLPEVVGQAGLLIDSGDSNALSQSIIRLLMNEEEYRRLAKQTERQASQFSWQQTAKQTLNIFQSLILS